MHRLRIAPDGLLTLFPFAALSTTPGHFLVERFAISYLSAGRDLAAPAQNEQPVGPAVIALSPGGDSKRQGATAFRSDSLERLDGAQSEARALQALLPRSQFWPKAKPPNSESRTCTVQPYFTSWAMD